MDTWRPKGRYFEIAVGQGLNSYIGKDLDARELQQKGGKAGLLEQRYVSQGQHLLQIREVQGEKKSKIILIHLTKL
jgi:hypothetical protein